MEYHHQLNEASYSANKFSRARAKSDPNPIIRAPECVLLRFPTQIIWKLVRYLELRDMATLVRTCRGLQDLLEIPLHDIILYLDCKNSSENSKYRTNRRYTYPFPARPSILEWAAERDQGSLIYKYHARDCGKRFPADMKNIGLSVAAQEGSLSCIPPLLAMGAGIEALTPGRQTSLRRTPLQHATENQQLPAMELLLDNGADIEAKCCVGLTALKYAFQFGVQPSIQLLLQKGADLSVVDLSRMKLSGAIQCNKEALVRFLLELGVDPLSPDIYYGTTACLAAMFNSMPIMKLLLEKGASPTIAILEEGATSEKITFEETTLLHQAALYGISEAIPLLLSHGAEISTRDRDGFQPLHIAAGAGSEIKLTTPRFRPLVPLVFRPLRFQPRREVVQALLEGGANVSAIDRQGRTALDHARRLGNEGILELLMSDQAGMLGEAGDG